MPFLKKHTQSAHINLSSLNNTVIYNVNKVRHHKIKVQH